MLFVAGMWFQDLFNYDFRRTEMCIIPYGTQMGEISFCAYNTGVGWRNIIEKMLQNATRRRVVQEARAPPGLRQGPGLSDPPVRKPDHVAVGGAAGAAESHRLRIWLRT